MYMTPNPSLAPPSAEVVFFFNREVNYLLDGNRLKGLTEERIICMCRCHDQNAHFLVESVILGPDFRFMEHYQDHGAKRKGYDRMANALHFTAIRVIGEAGKVKKSFVTHSLALDRSLSRLVDLSRIKKQP